MKTNYPSQMIRVKVKELPVVADALRWLSCAIGRHSSRHAFFHHSGTIKSCVGINVNARCEFLA